MKKSENGLLKKGFILLFMLISIVSFSSSLKAAPVSYDNSASTTGSNRSTLFANITVGSYSYGILLVGLEKSPNSSVSVSAISYNNTAMQFVTRVADTSNPIDVDIYELANPTSGTHPVSVTLSASDYVVMNIISYYNVAQIGAISVNQKDSVSYLSTTITTTVANSWVAGIGGVRASSNTMTMGSGWTTRLNTTLNTDRAGLSYDKSTTSTGSYIPSLYLCEGSNDIMPLYYIQIIEKQKQDIKPIPVVSLYFKWGMDNFNKKYGNIPLQEHDPAYNLNNIIPYCAGNNIEIFKSTNSPIIDRLKGYNFKQIGLLQKYIINDKPMSPKIFELYSYNRELYDKYIDYNKVTSELVMNYLYCMMLQGINFLNEGNPAGTIKLYKKAIFFPFRDEMKENEPFFYYNMSIAYKNLNNDDNQMKYLIKAINLKENYWQAYQELGEVYLKHGNLLIAKEMLEQAITYGSPNKQVLEQAISAVNQQLGKVQ